MEIKIDQLAIAPAHGKAKEARKLIEALGHKDWSLDTVKAAGTVRGKAAANVADLAFNYTFVPNIEFEVLDYTEGENFVDGHTPCAAHLGVHVETDEELDAIRAKMAELDIRVVQEVFTESHINPAIAGKRRYNYVIFGTRHLLGLDLKFIKRIMA